MLRFITAGESHGPALTAIIDGMPAGLTLTAEAINHDLARRQIGYGRGRRMEIEKDQAEILSGVRFSKTLGTPISLLIHNLDWPNWQQKMSPARILKSSVIPGMIELQDLPAVLSHHRHRNVLQRLQRPHHEPGPLLHR